VLVRKTLDRDSEGNPASVLQNITDITARKQIEEALREAGERFRFMAESMPQKIFTANPMEGWTT
jgi:PAS domain-containing protein